MTNRKHTRCTYHVVNKRDGSIVSKEYADQSDCKRKLFTFDNPHAYKVERKVTR